MQTLRSVLFTVLLFFSVALYCPLVIAGRLAGPDGAYRMMILWARSVLRMCERLCGLSYRVEGMEHLPGGNAVVLLKHSSAYETLAQLLIFPQQSWVLKRELTWAPFFGWALAVLRPIAIDRAGGSRAVTQVVAQGRERLADGLWVMIFPEGTRMPAGQTRRYGLSGALLARESGRPIVPVAHNAGDYWPRRGWRKRPGVVTFRIGPPVDATGRDLRELNAEVQAWIERQVAELRAADPGAG